MQLAPGRTRLSHLRERLAGVSAGVLDRYLNRMTDAGLIVLTAFISPFRAERELVRNMLPHGEFFEIFVDTPLEVAEARDVKGLYKKARAGEIANFTGITSPYEAPVTPELRIDTTRTTPEEAAERIVEEIMGVWSPTL